ncbi:uncharacterized protein TrAtP1_005653 [Trichoderma atroviride]|uniref:Calcipressin n=1 Tax=Hypocrea atroviridis (strain ATCC 20476 / IMI 206040) TaxID=452589 RepID=G9NSL1_HYPAI|nr:uncharacterized protein TRIATDRAFT_299076 [Trichoderma atroviride IMI 206040]EHK46408.1 hypothetical protein TRIATDRAFT_299076 [Trichoderma atroviride IMI 206040]UKZ64436.1 hypothetical protein TrAtP1_005653 [Trichoderma atroviride]
MEPTPRPSRSSSTSSRNKSNLSLDLSDLPPLIQPTPPSNTLLFTNLNNLDIFLPENLQEIRGLIEKVSPIHSFAPLKSFRRIIVSFFDIDSSLAIRQIWDGKAIMGERIRLYFGQPTPIEVRPEHLELPDAGKLFFISPPASPPHGWEMRMEDAPNKQVHADDLADALAKLHHRPVPIYDSPVTPTDGGVPHFGTRSRSSTLIYKPDEQTSPGLPAVFVEDMTDEPIAVSPLDAAKPIMAQTARPPVELMNDL